MNFYEIFKEFSIDERAAYTIDISVTTFVSKLWIFSNVNDSLAMKNNVRKVLDFLDFKERGFNTID